MLGLVTVGSAPRRAIFLGTDGSYTINYLAPESDFIKIPAWKVAQGKISDAEIRNKTVLIGLRSSLFSDMHPTPLGVMSGIGIHANEFISIVSGRMIRFVPDQVTRTIAWLVGLCVLALYLSRRFWLGLLFSAAALGGLFVGAQLLFSHDYLMEPFLALFGPFFATLAGFFSNSLRLLLENKGLETKVIHDKLTGLYKYEYLRECLDEEWKRCLRAKAPLSIVMTDLDRFKQINDTLGHEVGNEMIRRAGTVIQESARRYDVVSRYGGDEFVVLLWHSNLEEAKTYRERLREMYHAMVKTLEPALQGSSISIGVASFDPEKDPHKPAGPQALIEEADKDLFADKNSRRAAR
jgi:diguanylate cyclase (GGDEF)-like protein